MSAPRGPRRRRVRATAATVATMLASVCVTTGRAAAADEALVERGRQLFTRDTFGGNGRTCATCHRPDNNYTIDAPYIARLPASDPLFVHERTAALSALDRPQLLRRLGLVTVHADGFDKPGVARAVPPLLGLRQTTRPGPGIGRTAALGLSGDGAPAGGGLRQFVTAAVVEHMPRTLARRAGSDYRLPTADELAALEAFLLSLGRPAELDIGRMRFTATKVEQGRALFISPRSGPCTSCHRNAGALDTAGLNPVFDIGVQQRPGAPALLTDPAVPGDGGFGASSTVAVSGGRTGFGDGRFNTPSLVEAADTVPLFHDSSAPTVESAVFFYVSPTFASSPEGRRRPRVFLQRPELAAVAAFLRTINALENIRASNALLARSLGRDAESGRELVRLAAADTEDAIQVLTGASGIYPAQIAMLRSALALERQAQTAATTTARDDLARRASALKTQARGQMVTGG
jgi:cytochrome c peroxidase